MWFAGCIQSQFPSQTGSNLPFGSTAPAHISSNPADISLKHRRPVNLLDNMTVR